ncbi:hypothetical protein QUC26_09300 [Pseudomonas asiatica]|uniref:hypothetical protein n=1 Tax=Pseudomonas asiatica TaxID=2219225 RepID=UPI0025A0F8A9|nr:hypothetical protein [Pseudomonas asiatica]WJM55324.1 hypothetical protein QUC26_09300 [Pseudomonas asiatica]
MKEKLTQEQIQANVALVHSMVEAGKSRRTIIAETGLPERFVAEHMKGAVKGANKATPAAKTTRPNKLNTAAQQAYALAVRPQGCKDYELRTIAHSVYGATYTKDTIYSIKQRCAELVEDTGLTLQFVPDWVCDEAPTASRVALETLALELEAIIQDKVNSFMEQYATGQDADQIESTEAQRKQQYAARRHILKLAIKEYSPEPTSTLLARSLSVTDALDGTEDLSLTATTDNTAKDVVEAPVNDTGDIDAFFDFLADVEIAEGVAQPVEAESEVDLFAAVGVATDDFYVQKEARERAEQAAYDAYLKDLMDDNDSNEFVFTDTSDTVYNSAPKVTGFDITKYTGGKKNATARSGIEWNPSHL